MTRRNILSKDTGDMCAMIIPSSRTRMVEYFPISLVTRTKRITFLVAASEGKKGIALFLQAYQLVLRHQVYWLIHEQGFPIEFEVRARSHLPNKAEVVKIANTL